MNRIDLNMPAPSSLLMEHGLGFFHFTLHSNSHIQYSIREQLWRMLSFGEFGHRE